MYIWANSNIDLNDSFSICLVYFTWLVLMTNKCSSLSSCYLLEKHKENNYYALDSLNFYTVFICQGKIFLRATESHAGKRCQNFTLNIRSGRSSQLAYSEKQDEQEQEAINCNKIGSKELFYIYLCTVYLELCSVVK